MKTKHALELVLALSLSWWRPALFGRALGAVPGEATAGAAAPTFCKDVAPILQNQCVECHRRGQVAPFSLESYEQARKRASDISAVVEDRVMPPWKPVPHIGLKLKGDRSLSEAQIATVTPWAEAGAPEGNRAELPPPRHFAERWSLGTPDLILDTGADFAVPATGEDVYRCFVVPTNLPTDVYVSAIEYRPGNRRVVHHILSYVDTTGEARKKDALDAEPGYPCYAGPNVESIGDMGGWAPGIQPAQLADGFGKALPRKANIIVQIHYHPSGKPETDRTQVGLRFARKPVKRTLQRAGAWNPNLVLPTDGPDPSHIEAKAAWTVPIDVIAFGVAPHMHLLGRDMTMSARFPNGRVQNLIKIDDWDFNWQFAYRFATPIVLPKGTTLEVVAHYDNTAGSARNPNNPPKLAKWGEATTDEMCIGFIMLAKKDQDLTQPGQKDDLFKIIKDSGGWPILSARPYK